MPFFPPSSKAMEQTLSRAELPEALLNTNEIQLEVFCFQIIAEKRNVLYIGT